MLAARSSASSSIGSGGRSPLGAAIADAKPLAAYCCCFAASAAALLYVRALLPPLQAAQLDQWIAPAGWQQAAVSLVDQQHQLQQVDPLAWVGARASQQQPHQAAAALLPAASLQPGLGLHWYLLAQTFPKFRCGLLLCCQSN
jgi:hypothetical protein